MSDESSLWFILFIVYATDVIFLCAPQALQDVNIFIRREGLGMIGVETETLVRYSLVIIGLVVIVVSCDVIS